MSRRILTFSLFEAAKTAGLTKKQEEFLNRYTDGTWSYNPKTGLVDVDGNFHCYENDLTTLEGAPQEVGGDFYCMKNKLTSLEGAPQKVGGGFDCSQNKLTSLKGAPQEVDGYFGCSENDLTSLKGAPQEVGEDFYCSRNNLTSLTGAPQKVGGNFNCSKNNLTSLEGSPQKVEGDFVCDAFKLEKGQWNPKGWLEILKEGSPEAQKLILTLLSPEVLNNEIQQDPAGMIMKLKTVWNDEIFKETRDQLVWPKGYEQEADLLGDLDDVGF